MGLTIALVMIFSAQAQVRSNLYTKPQEAPKVVEVAVSSKKVEQKVQHNTSVVSGNLDREILLVARSFKSEGSTVLLPNKRSNVVPTGWRVGEVLEAETQEAIIAFPQDKTLIRARIIKGVLKGAVLLGEASLEKNSKRIAIEFNRLRMKNSDDVFEIAAIGLDDTGMRGLSGKYVSNESKLFVAEVISAAAAGLVDATISRSSNLLGNNIDSPTADTVTKKALVSALSKSAEGFAERNKVESGYVTLSEPTTLKVLVH